MREPKMRDWKIREQETYGTPHMWHNLVFIPVCTVISINIPGMLHVCGPFDMASYVVKLFDKYVFI